MLIDARSCLRISSFLGSLRNLELGNYWELTLARKFFMKFLLNLQQCMSFLLDYIWIEVNIGNLVFVVL